VLAALHLRQRGSAGTDCAMAPAPGRG